MQIPPGTNVPPIPELRRSWVIAALGGAAAAGLLAALFVLLAPAPPRRTIVLAEAAPASEASAAPSAAVPSASLAVSISPVHDWPEVTGLDRASAKATLDKHEAEVRKCYPEPPPEDPDVARPGIQVELTIKGDGTVEDVTVVEDDLGDEAVSACMDKVLRRMRFKRKPGEEATVNMLWTF